MYIQVWHICIYIIYVLAIYDYILALYVYLGVYKEETKKLDGKGEGKWG